MPNSSNFYTVKNANIYLVAFLCIFSLNPFFIWGWAREFQVALIFALIILYKPTVLCYKDFFLGIFVSILALYFYIANNASWLGSIYYAVSLFILMQLSDKEMRESFYLFKRLFALTLVPAIILWGLHHASSDFSLFSMGYVDESLMPDPAKLENNQLYVRYPFSIVLDYMLEEPYYRLFGPYDEPGVVGTAAALLLAADRFKIRSYSSLIIIVGGILSFSLAFYALSAMYIVFLSFKNYRYLIALIVAVIMVVGVASESEYIRMLTIDRVAMSESGGFSGDNRSSEDLNKAFDVWMSSPPSSFLLGIDWVDESGSSSWKQIPIRVGVFGVMVFILILSAIFLRYASFFSWPVLAFILVFIASLYQRTGVLVPAYIVIFSYGVLFHFKNIEPLIKKLKGDSNLGGV